jgi:hypothetical protein
MRANYLKLGKGKMKKLYGVDSENPDPGSAVSLVCPAQLHIWGATRYIRFVRQVAEYLPCAMLGIGPHPNNSSNYELS